LRSGTSFIGVWNLTTSCLGSVDDFRQIVVDYAAEAKTHGAVYLEAIFTPEPKLASDIGLDPIFEGYCAGAAEAEERHGVIVRLTPEQYRGCNPELGVAVARTALRYRDRGVVGFGLGGPEGRHPDAPHERAMRIAADAGLGLVPHAGEAAGPESIRSALRMGASPDPARSTGGRGSRPPRRTHRPQSRPGRLPDVKRPATGVPASPTTRCGSSPRPA
jgi:aminodeoxyfutalosine deaminase